jgi:hypothetical protein
MRVVGRQIRNLQFHRAIDRDPNDSLRFVNPAVASQRFLVLSIQIVQIFQSLLSPLGLAGSN